MKKVRLMFVIIFAIGLFTTQVAYANMAAPEETGIGSVVTFENNDEISVLSEVLDITVDGSNADIVATYRMKNTANENISTQSMFFSSNVEDGGVDVLVNGSSIEYIVDRYSLGYLTEIGTDDWKYAVLTDPKIANYNNDKIVDTITFQMDFEANEECDIVVSYRYRLGGYPDYNFNAKMGEIEYYLVPAAMWKDFSSLTINLYLDEDMPIIKSSNLEFEKIGTRTYQYVSDTLPEKNLEIVIDENWWQNIWSTLRSPYLLMWAKIFSPVILIALAVVVYIVLRFRKKRKI